MPIPVPVKVMEGLEAARASGNANMLDRNRVIEFLEQMGFDQAATWIAENREEYSKGIFVGFSAKEGED